MSALFDRLTQLFDEGHGVELPGLLNQGQFAPAEIRPAAVLIAAGPLAFWLIVREVTAASPTDARS